MIALSCTNCGQPIPANVSECPHCGRQVGYPNVTAAAAFEEEAALDDRLSKAQVDLKARGTEAKGLEFLCAVETAHAVINRYFGELSRLAWSDDQIYATYYQKVQAGLQIPETDRWNRLRGIADTILFGDANKPHIRFAALSLDGAGLENYGDCAMTIRPSMIAHRATVFEENSVIFMKRHGINGAADYVVPRGYRATWARRADLCLAKLGLYIQSATPSTAFAGILLSAQAKPEDDQFVEIHIWGSLTIRSFDRVVSRKWAVAPSHAEKNAVKARLDKVGVKFDAL